VLLPTTRSDHPVDPVLNWLDATGLPGRPTRSELASAYGVRADNPYRWDLVPLDIRPPPLTGTLWPSSFQAFLRYSPAMPPATLSPHVWIGDGSLTETTEQMAQGLQVRRALATRSENWLRKDLSQRLSETFQCSHHRFIE
jgi:hypothetical protein